MTVEYHAISTARAKEDNANFENDTVDIVIIYDKVVCLCAKNDGAVVEKKSASASQKEMVFSSCRAF
ncbi:Hypothetical protein NTJ_02093 [Nesidiocoris tenuis]|uniref:Uncharacterized protein n=1 Tax=Nesidiocoris tenuis TaxID=355587 RepID=A0ABN7AAF0_9HEMI|nr:Hypothetical protein NTJ_02093 [Nesidiocoris tenuis]